MSNALVICAQNLEDAVRQLARLTPGRFSAHVVLADFGPSRRASAIVRLGHMAAEVHTPDELSDLSRLPRVDRAARLASFLGEVLLPRALRPAGIRRVTLLWRDDWPDLIAGGSALVATDDDLRWWMPDDGDLSPMVPRGRMLARSLAPGDAGDALDRLIGSSPAMTALRERIRRRARLPFPILLVGETGTGKALCARALHTASGRPGRLVEVTGELLEPGRAASTLFGHRVGAISEVPGARTGLVSEAEHGTLFLDEVGATPVGVQAMLLPALARADDGYIAVQPVGSDQRRDVPVRLITAARRDPLVTGSIPTDLYYRLAAVRLDIPPLRERGHDVLEITDAWLKGMIQRVGDGPAGLDDEARGRVLAHRWPGNVRELEQVLRDAFLTARDDGRLRIAARDLRLTRSAAPTAPAKATPTAPEPLPAPQRHISAELARFVVAACDVALLNHGNDKTAAAHALGLKNARAFDRYRTEHARRIP